MRERQIDDAPVLCHRCRLDRLELERAVPLAFRLEPLGRLPLQSKLRGETRRFCDLVRWLHRAAAGVLEPSARVVVRELCLVPHKASIDVELRDVAILLNILDDYRDAIGALVQRREIGREPLGQHWKDLYTGVHGSRILLRVQVGGRLLRDQCVDVGDRDENANRAVAQLVGDLDLIEVARFGVVDRRPQEIAQVAHSIGASRLNRRRHLALDAGTEFGIEPILAQHPLRRLHEID